MIGANAIAGEWGHNPLPWPDADECPGPACYCGRSGCIETWLSGPAFARDYRQRTGRELTAARGAGCAPAPATPRPRRPGSATSDRLARALASVINIVDPDVIVLGGGLSNSSRLYERVPALWEKWVFSDRVDTRFVPATFGDSSGVRGAAWLWGTDRA